MYVFINTIWIWTVHIYYIVMTLTGDKHDEQQLNRNHFIRETSQKNKQQNRIRLHPREGLTLNIPGRINTKHPQVWKTSFLVMACFYADDMVLCCKNTYITLFHFYFWCQRKKKRKGQKSAKAYFTEWLMISHCSKVRASMC